jgi:hypothetical protein
MGVALGLLVGLGSLAVQTVDLQGTLDALAPGAVFAVPSGDYARAVLKQPVTLVGAEPAPTFDEIVLAGPGAGRVALANLRAKADLVGQGFDELALYECELAAGALRVTGLTYLELTSLAFTPNPQGTVEAPGASVLALDSTLGTLSGARLYRANSPCTTVLATDFERTLANDLVLAQPARIGKHLALSWDVPGPAAMLFGRTRTQTPLRAPRSAQGYWHLAGPRWMSVMVVTPGSLVLQVPPDARLLGLQVSFQAMGPRRAFSRVVSTLVR